MSNSNPGLQYNQVPTAGQWNSFFGTKQDWSVILDAVIAAGGAPGPNDVTTETARATAAEATNATAISTETTRATGAEATLTTAAAAAQTTANAALPKAGGTMVGAIVLAADPAAPLQPATKQYVDAATAASTTNIGRNLFHNGLDRVAQRGAGPFTVAGYTTDRWLLATGTAGGTRSISLVALADADRTAIADEAAAVALQCVVAGGAAAGDFDRISQRIEDVRRTAGRTVTVHFFAKAASGTPKIGLNYTQFFGTGGSPSASVTGTAQAVTISTTLAGYSATFTIPALTGKTLGTTAGTDYLEFQFWLSSGSTNNTLAGAIGVQSATTTIYGRQLEVGSSASTLEKPDIRYDLANCVRFFETGFYQVNSYNGAGTNNVITITLASLMRATPTVGFSSPTNVNCGAFTIAGQNTGTFTFTTTVTALGSFFASFNWTATADL